MLEPTPENDVLFYNNLGERIRMARKKKDLDQEDFAAAIGLTRTSIVNIEKGRQRPSVYQLLFMSEILNVPVTELLPPLNKTVEGINWKKWESVINEKTNGEVNKKVIKNFISFSLLR